MNKSTDEGMNGYGTMLKFVTPILVTVSIFILTNINARLGDIDGKLFRHLTNDEVHTPKSVVVTRAEFEIYQHLRDNQMEEIKTMVKDVFGILSNYTSRNKEK